MRTTITHQFVECIPNTVEDGVLYASIEHATAVHRCCCGCGSEIVTPLSPTDWALTFDGDTLSLNPSIGNWSLPCKSHYWIENNRVFWGRRLSQVAIEKIRALDKSAKAAYFAEPVRKDMSGNEAKRSEM
ncbi:MAG: hypothetical protein JNL19_00205 [Burkholderiales bacterium]|nr:hypothetical protein [Burkholderiales bacterium]